MTKDKVKEYLDSEFLFWQLVRKLRYAKNENESNLAREEYSRDCIEWGVIDITKPIPRLDTSLIDDFVKLNGGKSNLTLRVLVWR